MIETKAFWTALAERAIGVSIVTSHGSTGPAGFLGLSASHVTGSPPSMLVSIDDRTSALSVILESQRFAVNYLGSGQEQLASIFGGQTNIKGVDRFDSQEWMMSFPNAPRLRTAVAFFECKLDQCWRYQSTTIALGVVEDAHVGEGSALVYFRGKYISVQ